MDRWHAPDYDKTSDAVKTMATDLRVLVHLDNSDCPDQVGVHAWGHGMRGTCSPRRPQSKHVDKTKRTNRMGDAAKSQNAVEDHRVVHVDS